MAGKPAPIPPGFTAITPHLVCKDSAKAIEFYKKAFGAAEESRLPAPDGKRVMHAMIRVGGAAIMLADEFPDMGEDCGGNKSPLALGGSPVTIHLYVTDVDAVFKKAVDAGAKALMPPMDMFWGDRYAKVRDPAGHEWSIATHKRDMTPEQMKKEFEAMLAQMAKK